ncbi:MAG: hypothetical protein WDW19_01855 [Neisseriaceae bacterium]
MEFKRCYWPLLGLMIGLSACSGNSGPATAGQGTTGQQQEQVKSAEGQAKLFLQIQAKQLEEQKKLSDYMEQLRSTQVANAPARAETVQKAAAKLNEIQQELATYYQSLAITDKDIKAYVDSQKQTFSLQQQLAVEGERLNKLSDFGKKKLGDNETKKYGELVTQLLKLEEEGLNKKLAIEDKFSATVQNPALKEFYQVATSLNFPLKAGKEVTEKLKSDGSIKTREQLQKRLMEEHLKLMEQTLSNLQSLKIADPEVKAYRDQNITVLQKQLEVAKKAPEFQQEQGRARQLSPANLALLKELSQANTLVDEKLSKLLLRLSH